MMNGVKALGDVPPTARASVRRSAPAPRRTRRHDENLPWWLILLPAALVMMIFLVMALAILMGAPEPSESSDAEAEAQLDLPVIDENEVGKTIGVMPAFSR